MPLSNWWNQCLLLKNKRPQHPSLQEPEQYARVGLKELILPRPILGVEYDT